MLFAIKKLGGLLLNIHKVPLPNGCICFILICSRLNNLTIYFFSNQMIHCPFCCMRLYVAKKLLDIV